VKVTSIAITLFAAAASGVFPGPSATAFAQAKKQTPARGETAEAVAQGAEKPQPARPTTYGFEDPAEATMGWRVFPDPKTPSAVTGAERTTEQRRDGTASLRIDLDFGESRQSGEAAVDFILNPPGEPQGTTGDPVNLTNKVITAFVKFRRDLQVKEDRPPGLQLFVKDAQHRSLYGCWQNIEPVMVESEVWIRLTLRTSMRPDLKNECEGAEISKDTSGKASFDPTQIRRLGVKIAANESERLAYQGPAYLDSVSWK